MDENNSHKESIFLKRIKQVFAIVTIIVIVATPYLLIVDWKRFAPAVALVWMYSIVYFIFLKKKK